MQFVNTEFWLFLKVFFFFFLLSKFIMICLSYLCLTVIINPFEAIAVLMEGGDSLLDAIYEEDNLEGIDDVEMLDVEEGELVEPKLHNEKGKSSGGDVNLEIQGSQTKNRGLRARKKKNRRKKGGSRPVTDINR